MFEDILKELLVISSCQFPTIIHSLLLHLDSQVYRRNPDNKTHRPMIYINGNIYDYPSNLFVRGIGRSYHPRASGVGLGLNHATTFNPTFRYRYLYIYIYIYTNYFFINTLRTCIPLVMYHGASYSSRFQVLSYTTTKLNIQMLSTLW